jgi:hypothetical protein
MIEINSSLGSGPRESFIAAEARRLFEHAGRGADPGATLALELRPDQGTAVSVESGGGRAVVAGRDLESVLHGLYVLAEAVGWVFHFSGERVPAPGWSGFPSLSLHHTPSVRDRGIRMHLNFVQDQSFFSEEELDLFVDRMARLRLNHLVFHMYSPQEWFPFRYRGVEHRELALGNMGRRSLPADMIGRAKVKVRDHWFPREIEAVKGADELRDAVHDRYRRMMQRARSRSIRVAVSLEPETLPEAFRAKLGEWGAVRAAGPGPVATAGVGAAEWQSQWSGVTVAEADVRDPVVLDIAAERCLACMAAYPELNELHLISREGTAWRRPDAAEYRAELARLEAALHIPAGILTDAELSQVPLSVEKARTLHMKGTPYWTILPGETVYPTVLAGLRFVEMALAICRDPRVLAAAAANGVELALAIYSPHPLTIELLARALPPALPAGTRLHLLADYGARDIADSMGSWEPLLDARLKVGMISWLEFDGNMMLCQGWTDAIADNVIMGHDMGVQSMWFNHWRVRSLEHNARVAADAMWDAGRPAEAIVDDSLSALYGRAALVPARAAHRVLEEVTLFAKEHLFNVGFTGDWVFQNSTEPPGYDPAHLAGAEGLYREAARLFRVLAEAADHDARSRARALAELCAISALHLEAVGCLQRAKLPLVPYGAWPVEQSGDGAVMKITSVRCPEPLEMERLCAEAERAAALEREYMERYAVLVETCDEQGQLVMHHWGVAVPFGAFATALRERHADRRPVSR